MFVLDEKVTIWNRVNIPDEHKDEVLSLLRDGLSQDDIICTFVEKGIELDQELLLDTCETIDPEENGNMSTLELMNNNMPREIIFSNEIKSEDENV